MKQQPENHVGLSPKCNLYALSQVSSLLNRSCKGVWIGCCHPHPFPLWMTSSYLLHIVAFVWPWQHATHSILHIITTIFGRGSIDANFPLGAASQLRSNGETFNGECWWRWRRRIFSQSWFSPMWSRALQSRASRWKLDKTHQSSNPVSDDPPLISWSFDLIQVYKQTNKQTNKIWELKNEGHILVNTQEFTTCV